jgi:hypothetical protein
VGRLVYPRDLRNAAHAAASPARTLFALNVSSGFPSLPNKPQPTSITFKGCPPEGDGGDSELNILKNRVDVYDNWFPVSFDTVYDLPWPDDIKTRQERSTWSASARATIAEHEGLPIAVEGYLPRAKREKEESCNCHGTTIDKQDFHLYLTKDPNDGIKDSIVVEMTPRVRKDHPSWTLPAVQQFVNDQERVRISGWLMFDQEHIDVVGKYRGTVWEIHPIMRVEVFRGEKWVDLDDL